MEVEQPIEEEQGVASDIDDDDDHDDDDISLVVMKLIVIAMIVMTTAMFVSLSKTLYVNILRRNTVAQFYYPLCLSTLVMMSLLMLFAVINFKQYIQI